MWRNGQLRKRRKYTSVIRSDIGFENLSLSDDIKYEVSWSFPNFCVASNVENQVLVFIFNFIITAVVMAVEIIYYKIFVPS